MPDLLDIPFVFPLVYKLRLATAFAYVHHRKMEPFVPILVQARRDLERFQAQRANCLKLQSGIGSRKLRVAVAKLLTAELGAFRLHADSLACVVEDVRGEGVFSILDSKINSAVDMFFGQVMRLDDVRAPAPSSNLGRAHIMRVRGAGRRYMKTVRLLPHEGAVVSALRRCEQQFEQLCNAALALF